MFKNPIAQVAIAAAAWAAAFVLMLAQFSNGAPIAWYVFALAASIVLVVIVAERTGLANRMFALAGSIGGAVVFHVLNLFQGAA